MSFLPEFEILAGTAGFPAFINPGNGSFGRREIASCHVRFLRRNKRCLKPLMKRFFQRSQAFETGAGDESIVSQI